MTRVEFEKRLSELKDREKLMYRGSSKVMGFFQAVIAITAISFFIFCLVNLMGTGSGPASEKGLQSCFAKCCRF